MSQIGISGLLNTSSANYLLNNIKGTSKTANLSATDTDKTENDKLELKMLISDTKSDASASYFASLQEAIKDSKGDGFEAHRRVSKLTATHEKVASSKEYQNKDDSKSLVKDLTDAMDEKRKAVDEIVEKRQEREKAAGKRKKTAKSEENGNREITKETGIHDTAKNKSKKNHKITKEYKIESNAEYNIESGGLLQNVNALELHKNERVSGSHSFTKIYSGKSQKDRPTAIDQSV